MSQPLFVIVGHVNRGKSSIVSTLAADESVRIAPEPGTTVHNREFPMRIGGRTLYTLIDTPGFERARQALAWLREHETSTGDRADTVRRFVDYFAHNPRFRQECELLRPIVEGGAILYVVDGSVPFSPHYEAEMEVLRWTARPRMALINTIGPDDHAPAWRAVLDQYFSLVRVFDAHDAGFHDRVELLRGLRELREDWQSSLDSAIEALEEDRRAKLRDSAAAIAGMLVEMLTYIEEQRLPEDAEPGPYKQPLAEQYYGQLRRIEGRCRAEIRDVFGHFGLEVHEAQIPAVTDDLFDTDTWSRIGLSRDQLAAAATFTGALSGGLIDAAAGGTTVLLGSLIGGAIGFGSTWFGWKHLEEVKVLGQRFAGKLLRVGPMRSPRFPWIALDRALIYHDLVSHRAHAHRQPAELGEYSEAAGIVRHLDSARRNEIEKCFAKLRRASPDTAVVRLKLTESIAAVLVERDKKGGHACPSPT